MSGAVAAQGPAPGPAANHATPSDSEFPCSLALEIPFPTARLAEVALKSISVDKELSTLVHRTFSLRAQPRTDAQAASHMLQVTYRAATNRMLRVAVNSFLESLNLVVEVMEQLDGDMLESKSEGARDKQQKGQTGQTDQIQSREDQKE